jgi:hypothetical protein
MGIAVCSLYTVRNLCQNILRQVFRNARLLVQERT